MNFHKSQLPAIFWFTGVPGYPNTNYIPVAKSRILDAASLVASNLKNNVERNHQDG